MVWKKWPHTHTHGGGTPPPEKSKHNRNITLEQSEQEQGEAGGDPPPSILRFLTPPHPPLSLSILSIMLFSSVLMCLYSFGKKRRKEI